MSGKKIFKRSATIVLSIALAVTLFGLSVIAAGKDDNVVFAATKNSKKYIGTAKTDFCTEFVSANGDGSLFYRYDNIDLNQDKKMDIRDLVRLKKAAAGNAVGKDLDFNGSINGTDIGLLRRVLLGVHDFEIN